MPATGTPRARVSSDSGNDDGRGVFNELVELRGNRVALPSSVTSLLVADLPVFLWWQGALPPEGDAVLAEMIEMTTRMIVDSDQADTVGQQQLVAAKQRCDVVQVGRVHPPHGVIEVVVPAEDRWLGATKHRVVEDLTQDQAHRTL